MAATQPVDFGPIKEKLVAMIGAARDAFNRHSPTGLNQFKNLQTAVIKEIEAALQKLSQRLPQARGEEKNKLAAFQTVLTELQKVAATLESLVEPIRKKVQNNVLFSEKAVSQTNGLFDCQAGLLRSVFDIIQTDNAYLKKFVQAEGEKSVRECADFATEHETRLIEGLCTPQAAPIFLAILEKFQALAKLEVELMQKLNVGS